MQQRSTLVFLQTYPTVEAAQSASVEQITAVLKQTKHPNPTTFARKMFQTLHQPSLHADMMTTRTKSRLMLALVAQLLPLIEQIASYDKEISELFLTHEDNEVFSSLPGAGKRLAPRLLAEWGDDRSRYTGSTSVQALAGTAPVAFQSGNYAKAHKRHACLKPLPGALHQFAWQSTKQEGWALAYYQRKRSEGKSHRMAVRALANVWVRIIYAMWHQHTCYETMTFEQAQHRHASRAA